MCFSATASFTVATGTGIVGVLAVTKAAGWRELPLAAVPLTFAVQQAIEGTLWLVLGRGGSPASIALLANSFAVFALVLWPVYAPLAAGLVEPGARRRLALGALFLVAVPTSIYGLTNIVSRPYGVCVVQHSLSYRNDTAYPPLAMGAYLACTGLPFLLSTHKSLRWIGAIIVTGLAISAAFLFVALFSVWCFFAAAASVMVYLYFIGAREPVLHPRADA